MRRPAAFTSSLQTTTRAESSARVVCYEVQRTRRAAASASFQHEARRRIGLEVQLEPVVLDGLRLAQRLAAQVDGGGGLEGGGAVDGRGQVHRQFARGAGLLPQA